jgi:hypothetical protein
MPPGSNVSVPADSGLRRPIGVFRGVVVQQQHLEPGAGAGRGPLQHLPVAGGVAERGIGPTADHQVNAFGLAGVVVVQQQLRLLGQVRLAVAGKANFVPPAVPITCSGGMP